MYTNEKRELTSDDMWDRIIFCRGRIFRNFKFSSIFFYLVICVTCVWLLISCTLESVWFILSLTVKVQYRRRVSDEIWEGEHLMWNLKLILETNSKLFTSRTAVRARYLTQKRTQILRFPIGSWERNDIWYCTYSKSTSDVVEVEGVEKKKKKITGKLNPAPAIKSKRANRAVERYKLRRYSRKWD